MVNTVYLLLGGNIGDRLKNIQSAIQLIEDHVGRAIARSDYFVTAAWGNTHQPDFINQAVCIETLLSPKEVLTKLLFIEEQLGRTRTDEKWTERIIDIDILFYNHQVIDTPELKVPHPFIRERKFVLIPMEQIAKDFIHPVFNKSIEQLLHDCTDTLEVIRLT